MQKTIQLSLLSVALLSQLQADNQYTLENISVEASQAATLNKKDVTDSTTIITKEALEEARVTTLNEALNKLGGIAMTQNGGPGQSSSMFVRGMDTKRALVLIDGVRYNNPTSTAGAEFSQIMLYNVEQIEIIKGAQSGVWGSDAGSAVINIITSKATKGLHSVANVEYGSYDSKKASIQASYATDKYDILIGGMTYDVDGFSASEAKKSEAQYGKRYDELGLEKDKYTNQSLNAKLGYNITDIDRVELSMQSINSNIDFDNGGGIISFGTVQDSSIPNTVLANAFYSLAYKHKGSTNDINVQYNLSTFKNDVTSSYGVTKYKGSVNEIKADDKITYAKDSFVRIGASFAKFEDEEIVANETKSYSAISVFATNYNKLELFSGLNSILTESLRYDNYDNFDNALTGKFGIKQFLSKDYYISLNTGTGYNVPSSFQLYSSYGRTNLQPEKSFTNDITIGSDTLWITGFYNEITDFIDFDMISYKYTQTSGTSKFKGVEIGYDDYFFDSLGLNAMYTYVQTEDADGKELARRPKNQIDARATYYVDENFDLGVNAQYIGERYDGADKSGAETGNYTIVNFVSNVKVNKFVTLYGKIDNITDKYYQTVDGYATAGRSLYIGLNAKY